MSPNGLNAPPAFAATTMLMQPIAMMLPYCVVYILLWSIFFFVWVFVLGMPVGPAAPTYYP